jgi:hypothetical protein
MKRLLSPELKNTRPTANKPNSNAYQVVVCFFDWPKTSASKIKKTPKCLTRVQGVNRGEQARPRNHMEVMTQRSHWGCAKIGERLPYLPNGHFCEKKHLFVDHRSPCENKKRPCEDPNPKNRTFMNFKRQERALPIPTFR